MKIKAVVFALFTFFMLWSSADAMLDIFDHPQNIEKKKEVEKSREAAGLLDYPKDCFLKGDYNEALKSARGLLVHPKAKGLKAEVSYLVGINLLKLNRLLEARSYFNDVLLAEKGSEDLKLDAMLGIGDSYLLEGSLSGARDVYDQILTKYPNNQKDCVVYYRLGETLYKMDRPREAKYYLDKIQKEFPFSFEARLAGDMSDRINLSGAESTEAASYNVQVGCFNDKGNADKLRAKLVKRGFEAYIEESQDDQTPRFRVWVGPLISKSEAERLETRLKTAGYSTKICP